MNKKIFIAVVASFLTIICKAQLFTVDNTFTVGAGFDGKVSAVELQGDGKIVVAGNFLNYNGIYTPKIARLNTDGSLDNSFTSPIQPVIVQGMDITSIFFLKIQPNGQILISGKNFFLIDSVIIGVPAYANFARINANGTYDNLFTSNVFENSYLVLGLPPAPSHNFSLQPDGSIFFSMGIGITKFTSSGELATTTCGSPPAFGSVDTIDGNVMLPVSMLFNNDNAEVFCFGLIDSLISQGTYNIENTCLFNSNFCITNTSHKINGRATVYTKIAADKFFVGGYFSLYDDNIARQGVLLDNNGNMDNTFALSSQLQSESITSAEFTNGKLLLGVNNGMVQGVAVNRLAIFNADGTYDLINSSNLTPNSTVNAIKSSSNGEYVYCGGDFLTFNNQNYPRICRLKKVSTGISEQYLSNSIVIASNGNITVVSINDNPFETAEIYNIEGKLLRFANTIERQSGNFETNLSNGNYLLSVKFADGNVVSKKFFVP